MLTNDLLSDLLKSAELSAPHEMCGLLFPATGFIKCRNTATRPEQEFHIDPDEYQAACRWFGKEPWALVHSHPGKSAAPSPKDCQLMDALQLAKMNMAMLIVGLDPVEIRLFRKREDSYCLEWHWADGRVQLDRTITWEIHDQSLPAV